MRIRSITILALALAILAAPAAGQESPRNAVWFSIGLAAGSVGVDCPDCGSFFDSRVSGFAGQIGIGWTVSPALVIGLEGQGWVKNDADLNRRLAAGNVVALFYPSKTLGLYLKGGIGYVRAVGETPDLTIVVVGNGMAWTVGAGFDIYLSETVALTPYFTYLGSANTSTSVNDVGIDINLNPNMWQVGGALTIP